MFPIKRFGDEHLSKHRVDIEHLIGWLICSHPSDAVPDWDVLVLVWTNLHDNKQRGTINQLVNQVLYKSLYCVSLSHMPFFFWSIFLSGGEETNSNTFTMANLHLLVLCAVYYSETSLWYTALEFNNFVLYTITETWYWIFFTGNTRTHVHIRTHTHTYHILALFLATTYSRIPLELPQGALCILFGRIR